MSRSAKYVLATAVAVPLVYMAGCRSPRITIPFDLNESLGTFVVTAGEPAENSGTGSLPSNAPNIGSGSIQLDPDDISFTPADNSSGKGLVNYQGGGSFTVTAAIAAADDLATVCDDPVDSYGPFTVTLNEDNTVASISPDSVELEQATIDLLNGGEFSICLIVTSTVDGTISIDALSFSLGL